MESAKRESMNYTYLDTPIGRLLIAGNEEAIYEIRFPNKKSAMKPEPGWVESSRKCRPAELCPTNRDRVRHRNDHPGTAAPAKSHFSHSASPVRAWVKSRSNSAPPAEHRQHEPAVGCARARA